jgi:flavonoid 3',5'-hydroxylase
LYKRFQEISDDTFTVAARMIEIERHRRELKEREKTGNQEGHVPDMVDVLLQAPLDNAQIIPDKTLILVITDLLNAGTESSAGTVHWAMAELMKRPDSLRLLQEELERVIGPNRVPVEGDIPNLPYLQAVLKEALRLHPPAAINLPRVSNQPFEFRGFNFPKQTRLILNYYAIQRDQSVYESPDSFKPERFVDRSEVKLLAAFESFELTPFSAGRRNCPGADLGHTMASMMLAHLVHGFDWALPHGVESVDMTEQFGLTVTKKSPLILVAKAKPAASLY